MNLFKCAGIEKPDLPIIYDERDTEEYVVGYYRYSDGTLRPVYRRFITWNNPSGTFGNDILLYTSSGWNAERVIALSGIFSLGTVYSILAFGHRLNAYQRGFYTLVDSNEVKLYTCTGASGGVYGVRMYVDFLKVNDTPT